MLARRVAVVVQLPAFVEALAEFVAIHLGQDAAIDLMQEVRRLFEVSAREWRDCVAGI